MGWFMTFQEEPLGDKPSDETPSSPVVASVPDGPDPGSLTPVGDVDLVESVPSEDYTALLMSTVERQLTPPEPGQVLAGRVIHLGTEHAVVDIGYRVEGLVPLEELQDETGRLTVAEGDTIFVQVLRYGPEQDYVPLSKRQADFQIAWERVVRAYQEGTPLTGRVVRRLKGGYFVDLGGARAFLPGSQVDLRKPEDYDAWLGQTVQVKVLSIDPQKRTVVVSRRALLEEEREKRRRQVLAQLRPGAVLEGVVKNITDYGVFVDLGGVDGMIHKSDLSWQRVQHPSEVVRVGQALRVKVLAYDEATGRVSLGLKQLTPDPWTRAVQNYEVGQTVTATVTNVVDYGAFAELEPGVSGLIHVSELAWSTRVRHPSQVLKVGDTVQVRIIDIDPKRKRISLSLKAVLPNPVDEFLAKYPPGSVVTTTVDRFNMRGAITRLDEFPDVLGFIPLREITWQRKPRPPSEYLRRGQVVTAQVLRGRPDVLRVYLSLRRLQPNPWKAFAEQYAVGDVVRGTVIEKFENGCFVRPEGYPDIDALLPRGHYIRRRRGKGVVVGEPEVGQTLECKLIQMEPRRRRIVLSLRELYRDRIRQELEAARQKREADKVRLGDIVAQELEKLKAYTKGSSGEGSQGSGA
jgi:small subunit ribosomal protein S1